MLPRSAGIMLISALASAPVTIARNRTASVRGTSSTKKLGARCGTVDRISEVMLVWIAASVKKDRKSVVEGKRVSVSVALGGRRILKKKKQNTKNKTTSRNK